MRALVVGASAGVGRALSEALASRGDSLLLVASDVNDLEAQAAHLRLVYDIYVQTLAVDASQPTDCLDGIRISAETFGHIDGIFFPIGVSHSDDRGFLSIAEGQQIINANLLIVIGVISQFLPDLLASENGSIVGFGSVAAIRGRRTNIVYAAAKRGLESYFESLRHLTVNTGVKVQFYRLGYVATQQSFGKNLLFSPISPQQVARTVVRNLGKNTGLINFPRYWSIVAKMISVLPWFIFKRLNF
jgi:short-subunit dehydrogenase